MLDLFTKVSAFESEAKKILSAHASSHHRIIHIEDAYAELSTLSEPQQALLTQSFRSIENGLHRAAIVMSWVAVIDFLERILGRDSFARLNAARPRWGIASLTALREGYPESQILDAMKDAGYLSKGDLKSLQGMLHRRNEAAHPGDFEPDLNVSLGYVAEVLQRLQLLVLRERV